MIIMKMDIANYPHSLHENLHCRSKQLVPFAVKLLSKCLSNHQSIGPNSNTGMANSPIDSMHTSIAYYLLLILQ